MPYNVLELSYRSNQYIQKIHAESVKTRYLAWAPDHTPKPYWPVVTPMFALRKQ